MALNKLTNKALPTAVKERLQFTPSLPAKQKPWGTEWVDAEKARRDVRVAARADNNPRRDSENDLALASAAATTFDYDRVNTRETIKKGFLIHKQGPGDDEYTNQHNDGFYETITSDDGVEGLLERQNYLDRI